jgi:hypothetical protein
VGHEAESRKLNSRPLGTLKLDHDRRSEIGRESIARARGLMRCPACFIIRVAMPKEFTCQLTRCPHVFANIQPPAGSQPAVRVEPGPGRRARKGLFVGERREKAIGLVPSAASPRAPNPFLRGMKPAKMPAIGVCSVPCVLALSSTAIENQILPKLAKVVADAKRTETRKSHYRLV